MESDTDTPENPQTPSSRSPSTTCSWFLILLVLLPLSILAAIYGVAWLIEEAANRVMEGTERWGNALADWAEEKRKRQIPTENVKEHAPLSAAASVDYGVGVETTVEHVNRAADRGCVSRLVEQSRMAAIPPRGAPASYGVEGVWRALHGFRTMTKKARYMFATSPPQSGIRITAASSISKV